MFQKLENNILGYKLFDLGSHYELRSGMGIYRGTLKQICTYAVVELDFDLKEIELGIVEMERNFHSGCEFGVRRKFMFTFDENNTKLH